MNRRDFLKLVSSGAAGASVLGLDDLLADADGRKDLPMRNFRALVLKRGDDLLRLDLGKQRDYVAACYLLRDVRARKMANVHPWLLHTASLLQTLVAQAHGFEPLIINSGYRTPDTNTIVGGAPHSYHMTNELGYFHAMDVRMHGVSVETLSRYALAIQQGGVGKYHNKGFVHIDVGPPRVWVDV